MTTKLVCPNCGEDVWDGPMGHKLAKCWGCGVAFDTMDIEGEFDFEPAYIAAGWAAGIAWRAYKYETEADEDTEWSGIENPTGRIIAHMIGDDANFAFEPEELTPISDDDYCGCCGQVGCQWG